MGNRAVITTTENMAHDGVGVYLHWNGGRDCVEAFLEYCKLKGYRTPDSDCYGFARLCQVIGNYFGGSTSIGIDTLWHLDMNNFDNGTYIIEGWEIVDRAYFEGQEQMNYPLQDMLLAIDEAQPENEQLGKEFILAPIVPVSELKEGDKVFVSEYGGAWNVCTVVGFGGDEPVNGRNVKGIPYVDLYEKNGYDWNINNYITSEMVRCKCRAGDTKKGKETT